MKIKAYAVFEKGMPLKPFEYELQSPKPNEVLIKISHCGICHSDLHLINDDWEINKFPIVPGHEIVGLIKEIGSEVTRVKVGDRVGVGWQCGSCSSCRECRSGLQNICPGMKATCLDQYGGFSEGININQDYVFKIPENLDSAKVSPLLCGGATVYNPLEHYNVRPWMKVGIIGMGGLGHMAIKFAKAMGCEITVFSTSKDKESDAKKFGATEFITNINEPRLDSTLDFIISTASADLDWDRYLEILKPQGRLCFVGALSENISVDFFNLMNSQKTICAGSIGSPLMIEQMLDFASRHNIEAQVEVFKLKDVNIAIERLKKNEIRYRAVVEI